MALGHNQRHIAITLRTVNEALGTDYHIYFGKTRYVSELRKEVTTKTVIYNGMSHEGDEVFRGTQYMAEKFVNELRESDEVQLFLKEQKIRCTRARIARLEKELKEAKATLADLTDEEV
jgi:hypothetical protein